MKNIIFPRAFAFSIDDLGWNEGSNLSFNIPPGPLRVGIKRKFDINDYSHILKVARSVGVRIQCLFVLSEMDRTNVLAKYPTTTQYREKWDNSSRICDQQIEIMRLVLESAAYMELGMHGTGHEFWADDGIQRRAEWYNLVDRQPWPEEVLEGHIEAFREIISQYGFTPENGHSFPESFVACAYGYYWNPKGDYSLGKLLGHAGIKYANTDFSQIPELNPPAEVNGGGFDHGVHVLNRMNYGNLYYSYSSLPVVPIEMQGTDLVESHWANWLATDDFLQPQVTEMFINYYRMVERQDNRFIARNTEQLHSQWLYRKYTSIKFKSQGNIDIDNTSMPSDAYQNDLLGNMILKIPLDEGNHVSEALLNTEKIPAYYEANGFGFLILPRLGRSIYNLIYRIGSEYMSSFILYDGTYNVYKLEEFPGKLMLNLKMYGTQTVNVRCKKPLKIISHSKGLVIEGSKYSFETGYLYIIIKALNMQGSTGNLEIFF